MDKSREELFFYSLFYGKLHKVKVCFCSMAAKWAFLLTFILLTACTTNLFYSFFGLKRAIEVDLKHRFSPIEVMG